MKAIVVGTGFGSLASAIRLRALGFEVEILESCPDPGGRARSLRFHGEEFDAGPTVITAPWLIDELFELLGEQRSEHIEFLPCDPWYRIIYPSGETLDLTPSIDEQVRQIEHLSPDDAKNFHRYLAHSDALYRIGYEQLGDADFSSFGSMVRAIPHLIRLGAFTTVWAHTARYFSDKRVRQAFSLQPLLVGGNPLTTTSIYSLIHSMERKGGIWFAKGGTGVIIRELIRLAQRHGITVRLNTTVTGILSNEKRAVRAVSCVSDGTPREVPCSVCVWGGDPVRAYQTLGVDRLSWVERARMKTVSSSMGLYVLYFKTARTYPEVAHHTIVLSERWEELLREIFTGTSLPPDPSLYLHRPAATDPSFNRPDGDLFYVLAPVPHLGNFADWAQHEERFKRVVLSILDQRVLPGVADRLVFAESIDPRYFQHTLHSHLGAAFSIAPTLQQSAWFRFHNRADKVSGLYLCGAGVHPGGGIPGVVTSAKVVERLVRSDFSVQPLTQTTDLSTHRRVA